MLREIMLIIHFVGLCMGLGTGFGHLFLGMAAKKMNEKEAQSFKMKTLAINKMGYIGLFLLVLSGGYLMTPYWSSLGEKPTLVAKLLAVLVLIVMIVLMNGIAKKVNRPEGSDALGKLEQMGKITLPLSIIIIVLAVLTFH